MLIEFFAVDRNALLSHKKHADILRLKMFEKSHFSTKNCKSFSASEGLVQDPRLFCCQACMTSICKVLPVPYSSLLFALVQFSRLLRV